MFIHILCLVFTLGSAALAEEEAPTEEVEIICPEKETAGPGS
jgi:hypothetical protein